MKDSIFIGLDVHKATISVAVADGERGGEVRDWGKLPNRPDRVRKLAGQLGTKGHRLFFCYEAGPCGYGLYRQLVELGHECMVVAPSLIPVKAGDRVKTDRRDARMLAKLHRASELTAVWVPDVEHEAMRDLVRARAPLSKATVDSALRMVKAFILWLAGQPGYKSRIAYADAEYFNLNAKDARIAHTARDAIYPSPEQCRHAFGQMPSATPLQHRDKALFAFLMLTGARDGAVASMRLKHVDLVECCVYQDARDVKTKFAKSFTTWFFPVDDAYLHAFCDWVTYLRQEELFGPNDALFPKPRMGLKDGAFAALGLSRDIYSNAGKLRAVIKDAFTNSGLPAFGPHSFRKTLGLLANEHCKTPEQFKAWSMNLGHENIATTLSAYCPVSHSRQGELIRNMA